jgi:Domain of unknown function (DUF1707)
MSTEYPTQGPRRVRASDAEREQIATILRAAMSEGRLTLEVGEERLAATYAATYRDELGPLTADLPDGGRRALVETPEVKAAVRRFVRARIGLFAVIVAALVGLWVLSGAHFFWPAIPLFFLTFALLRWHWFGRWRRYGWYGPYGWRGGYGWYGDRSPGRDRAGQW